MAARSGCERHSMKSRKRFIKYIGRPQGSPLHVGLTENVGETLAVSLPIQELCMSLDTPSTATLDQPSVVRNSKWKLLLMILLALAFVLVGLLMVISSSHGSKNFYVGLLAMSFFGLGLLVFLLQMFTPSIILTIDNEGIHSFYPFWRPLTVKWQEVNSISSTEGPRSRTYLTFEVSVSSKFEPYYIARNFKSGKIPFNLRFAHGFGADISVSLVTATLSYTKIIALIRLRYAEQIRQYGIHIWEK